MVTAAAPARFDPPRVRLEGRGLVLRHDGRAVLDGASLTVRAGEAVSVQGASGSGKSTLLRALATLVPVDEGRVFFDATDAEQIEPTVFRTRVAYVPQRPVMLEGTVRANVCVGPGLRGVALSAQRVGELLARVGLPEHIAAREARDLSGGELQRVALARALANEPAVLLLDEPTAALDPDSAAHVLVLLGTLARGGLSLVVVTHTEAHASALAPPGSRYRCALGRVEPTEP